MDASPRAKQNSQMMYECLMASITKEAKSALVSRDQDFHEDGLSLFFHVVSQLFTTTFSNTQATHDNLSDFHPKRFRYNVIQVNNYISSAMMPSWQPCPPEGGSLTKKIFIFNSRSTRKSKLLRSGLCTSFSWSPLLLAPQDTP